MDIISEGSNETKILAARHISADKSFPEANNAVNSTLLCHTYSLQPDFLTYFAALQNYAYVIWSVGAVVLIATCILYAISIRIALRHWREYIDHVAIILAVYPIVTAAGFVTLLVPRSRLVAEAIAQEAVMIALYQLYCLIIAECNGPEQLVRRTEGRHLETRVMPCCCWPCCIIPQPLLQKKTFTWLRGLVLQMPIIQAFVYIFVLVLWVEDISVYFSCFTYIQPVVIASILTGVWGMVMCVRAAEAGGAGGHLRKRFLVVQLALIVVKLQYGFAKGLPDFANIPCLLELNPSVFVNMIHNCIMIFEMLLLSIVACCLYRSPPGKSTPRQVAAIEDVATTADKTKQFAIPRA